MIRRGRAARNPALRDCVTECMLPTLAIPRSRVVRACVVSAAAVVAVAGGVAQAAAQADRIWGRVHTSAGELHEGFILWNGPGAYDAASWADVLDGTRAANPEHYEAWLSATGRERPVRSIELRGYRVSWNEDDPDYPFHAATGIRFGWLSAVNVPESGGVELVLRSAQDDASTSPPPLILRRPLARSRALEVDEPGAGSAQVEWRNLRRVEFARPPAGTRPRSARLHGTVEDRFGRSFTGYVAWDSDEVLESEVLDGFDEDGKDHEIPFGDIASIERGLSGSRVVLASGDVVNLTGTNDVNRDNRGVRVFDPALGMIKVEWEEFGVLRFHPPADARGYESFAGGDGGARASARRLAGVVTTRQGEQIEGLIRWDAEHEWSWELLQGESQGAAFAVEFGSVTQVARREDDAIAVSLVNGRVFELSRDAESEGENRGLFVLPSVGVDAGDPDTSIASEPVQWVYVAWEDFAAVRFDLGAGVRNPFRQGASR